MTFQLVLSETLNAQSDHTIRLKKNNLQRTIKVESPTHKLTHTNLQ